MEGWKTAGGALDRKPALANTRWVTRERPKIDRIACPWLLARFVDPEAEFLYVPTKEVLATAKERDAVPYDVPDVHFTHEGERCSFDAFIRHFHLDDPALAQLATIVRSADTARLDLAPQASGLAAISLGLSRKFADDHEMLKHGLVMYDALYAWCKTGQDEVHTWNPAAYR
ncbi:MAG TPA: chromate resistance protein ChrB domain-containing protein [Burkholderiales bacterium]|nr:chromate resistance protein ChrB domain-containing protein [Burkholderiales bacterium]